MAFDNTTKQISFATASILILLPLCQDPVSYFRQAYEAKTRKSKEAAKQTSAKAALKKKAAEFFEPQAKKQKTKRRSRHS